MATISDHPADARGTRTERQLPAMWASLAISVIWIVLMLDALFGPDFVSTNSSGTVTKIPSAIFFAPFVWLATRAIAKRAFGSES